MCVQTPCRSESGRARKIIPNPNPNLDRCARSVHVPAAIQVATCRESSKSPMSNRSRCYPFSNPIPYPQSSPSPSQFPFDFQEHVLVLHSLPVSPPVSDMPGHREEAKSGLVPSADGQRDDGHGAKLGYDGVAEEVQETLNGILQKIQVCENVMMAIKAIERKDNIPIIPESEQPRCLCLQTVAVVCFRSQLPQGWCRRRSFAVGCHSNPVVYVCRPLFVTPGR